MTYISKNIFPLLLGLCVASFFLFNPAKAEEMPLLYFGDYFTGDICSHSSWSCTGTSTGTVQNSIKYGSPNALQFSSTNNLSTNYISYTWSESNRIPLLEFAWYIPTGTIPCISQVNASSTQFAYACIESGADVYLNGINTGKHITYDAWNYIHWEISTTTTQQRIKIGNDTYSSWSMTTGGASKNLYSIRFDTNGATKYSYLDSLSYDNYTGLDVTIIDIGDNSFDTVQVGLADGVMFPLRTSCTVGETCFLDYKYGYPVVGRTLYIYESHDFPSTVYNPEIGALASSTLPNSLLLKGQFSIDSSIATTTEYCYYLMASSTISSNDEAGCGIYLTVSTDAYLDDILAQFDCNCDDIATSTGIFDEFRYSIECGMRKTGCFFLKPQTSALTFYQSSTNDLTDQFPFSIARQVKERFEDDAFIATTSITMAGVFPDTGSNYTFLDSDDIEFKWGTTLSTIRDSLSNILWFLLILYFLRELFYQFKPVNEE